jgi:hypothetical protein
MNKIKNKIYITAIILVVGVASFCFSATMNIQLPTTQRGDVFTPGSGGVDDNYGRACSISSNGNVMAVGAYAWDGEAGSAQGCVYIYDKSGSNWVQRGNLLTASDADADDQYGNSCSLSADGLVQVVGAKGWKEP